jgi:hypothetical protein
MQYLLLLHDAEGPASEPDSPEWNEDMAAYEQFDAATGDDIIGGEALHPSSEGVVIRPGGDTLVVTEGAFTETAEVVGGYFVIDADDRDQALAIARQVPTLRTGAVELRPVVSWWDPGVEAPAGATRWLALLHGEPTEEDRPGTPEWDAAVARHADFERQAGSHLLGGAALHPPETATTLRGAGAEVTITDGPFAETAEVVGGLYELWATDRDEAIAIAARIPVDQGAVELRPIVELDG